MLPEKTINFQSAHQLQAKPRPTEVPYPLNPNPTDIDLYPCRLGIPEQSALEANPSFGDILDTQPAGLIHFTKPGHYSLARSPFGSVGLDQCPVAVLLAILCACQFSDIHAEIIDNQETMSTR
jgi:hypothetical protein